MEHISIIAQFINKNAASKTGMIKIRGYYKRKQVAQRSTGYKIHADQWDPELRKVREGTPNARLINACIDKKVQEISAQLMKKEIMGATLNRSQVKKAVQGVDDSRDFLQFCRDRIQIDYKNAETRRTYRTECDKLETFRPVIRFCDLGFEFFAEYKHYMQEGLENDVNTIFKAFKMINTFVEKALLIGGIIDVSPFEGFNRGKYIQKPKIGLEMDQCALIEPVCTDPTKPADLRQVATYFLLMCYSGMRFSDARRFNPNVNVRDGRFVMTYQKWQTNVNYEVHARLARIIDLVRDNPLKLSNRDFNLWLKVLGPLVGIELPDGDTLNSHKGRHSLGGWLADLEIPEAQAGLIMGHKDPRSIRVYYHMKNKAIDRSVKKMDSLK
jgi:hypothetical protein